MIGQALSAAPLSAPPFAFAQHPEVLRLAPSPRTGRAWGVRAGIARQTSAICPTPPSTALLSRQPMRDDRSTARLAEGLVGRAARCRGLKSVLRLQKFKQARLACVAPLDAAVDRLNSRAGVRLVQRIASRAGCGAGLTWTFGVAVSNGAAGLVPIRLRSATHLRIAFRLGCACAPTRSIPILAAMSLWRPDGRFVAVRRVSHGNDLSFVPGVTGPTGQRFPALRPMAASGSSELRLPGLAP
jgi:hypothetical protein